MFLLRRVVQVCLVLVIGLAYCPSAQAGDIHFPLAHWSFDNPSDPYHDDSGNGHDLTIPGAWTSVPGWTKTIEPEHTPPGNAIDFADYQGGGPRTSNWDSNALMTYPGPDGFTVAFLAKLDPGTKPTVRDYWQSVAGGEAFVLHGDSAGMTDFMVRDDFDNDPPPIATDAPAFDGRWVHLAGVYESTGNALKLYINGILRAEGSLPGGMREDMAPYLYVCGSPYGTEHAIVDEVRIYDYGLSQPEILQIAPEPGSLALLSLGVLLLTRRLR